MLGPSGRDEFVEEGADDPGDIAREAPALLGEVLVVEVRSVDLTVHLLDGTKPIGGVEHLQSAMDRGFELPSLGCPMVAVEDAEPVGLKA